jgi:hypothetical protein
MYVAVLVLFCLFMVAIFVLFYIFLVKKKNYDMILCNDVLNKLMVMLNSNVL